MAAQPTDSGTDELASTSSTQHHNPVIEKLTRDDLRAVLQSLLSQQDVAIRDAVNIAISKQIASSLHQVTMGMDDDRVARMDDENTKATHEYLGKLMSLRQRIHDASADDALLRELAVASQRCEREANSLRIKFVDTFSNSLDVLENTKGSETNATTISVTISSAAQAQEIDGLFQINDKKDSAILKEDLRLHEQPVVSRDWTLADGYSAFKAITSFPAIVEFCTVYVRAAYVVGGEDEFKAQQQRSRRMEQEIGKDPKFTVQKSQDNAFQALSIRELFASAERKNVLLGKKLKKLQGYLNRRYNGTIKIKLVHPPCKGAQRAGDKALMKYGNDVTKLKDLVRATIEISTTTVAEYYDVLEDMMTAPFMRTQTCHWVSFEDRMQRPMTGGYRDTQWGLNLAGHLCELQTTMTVFAEAKEVGHSAYEGLRLKTESCLLACVRQMPALLKQLLKTGANPNGIKDKHGLYPLHFAAFLGDEESVKALLEHGADPFKSDSQGRLPLQLALEEGWPRIVHMLVEDMEKKLKQGVAKPMGQTVQKHCLNMMRRAADMLAASDGASAVPDGQVLSEDLVNVLRCCETLTDGDLAIVQYAKELMEAGETEFETDEVRNEILRHTLRHGTDELQLWALKRLETKIGSESLAEDLRLLLEHKRSDIRSHAFNILVIMSKAGMEGAKNCQVPMIESWHAIFGIERATAVKELYQLTNLSIEDNKNIGPEGAKALKELSQLKSLYVGCSNNIGTEGAKALKKLSQIRNLTIEDHNEIGAKGMEVLKELRHLTNLTIGGWNNIGVEGALALKDLNHLTSLIVGDGNNIGPTGAKALKTLKKLTSLKIGDYNNIGTEVAMALKEFSQLTSLTIGDHNQIGPEGVTALTQLSLLTSLTIGDYNKIGADGAMALKELRQLKSLSIGNGNNIGPEGATALQGLSQLTNLTIGIANGIGPRGMCALKELRQLTKLTIGDHNGIGADGVDDLQELSHLKILTIGDGNSICAAGAEALGKFRHLTSLTIGWNDIGAEGATALNQLSQLTSLTIGDGNNIGPEGAKALKELRNLTNLTIGSNNIGAEGAEALKNLGQLKSLTIGGENNIGAEGAQALQELSYLTSLTIGFENNIGAEGAMALKGLIQLRSLIIGDKNNIGAKGANALINLNQLTNLTIGEHNEIGADGAKALTELNQLTNLTIGGWNNIGPEGAKALKDHSQLTFLTIEEEGNNTEVLTEEEQQPIPQLVAPRPADRRPATCTIS